jgi:hypothetical protein
MRNRRSLTVSVLLLSCLVASGKNKKQIVLPADILKAHTVFVMVAPQAGVEVQDPNGDSNARRDVENALVKWGRLDPVIDEHLADLVITVRKGHGKMAEQTIAGTPINNPPIMVRPSETGITAGGRSGSSGIPGDVSNGEPPSSRPSPQTQVGPTQDMFTVYRGNRPDPLNPLDLPPVWRYTAKDALASPDVPAVEEFRKVVTESEKQLASHP